MQVKSKATNREAMPGRRDQLPVKGPGGGAPRGRSGRRVSVLECGSPLPLFFGLLGGLSRSCGFPAGRSQSARGLAHSTSFATSGRFGARASTLDFIRVVREQWMGTTHGPGPALRNSTASLIAAVCRRFVGLYVVSVALSLSSIQWRRGPGRGGPSKKPPSPTLPPLVPRGERESRTGLNRYLGLPTRGGDGSWLGRSRRVSLGVFIRVLDFIPLGFPFSSPFGSVTAPVAASTRASAAEDRTRKLRALPGASCSNDPR